ncbi:MAG: hypothetical protein ACRCVJ_11850 [Clostridium sp.]|uniref:hypothetical protein n=1 Tax=Clostridium sp. TaxID=1506 RepID=UPI003F362863
MYKCIKRFYVDCVDGDGFYIDNKYFIVEEGTLWNIPEDKDYRLCGGEIRLENDKLGWIEISKEDLEKDFIKI